jgi:hypothetical protein
MLNRNLVVPLIEKYFPSSGTLVSRGTVGLDHIIKDWLGNGTTCGYLPHWLWWRLGCDDAKLICRHEPDTPFVYANSYQVNRVYAHSQFTKVSTPTVKMKDNDQKFLRREIGPKAGDAIIIQGPPDAKGNETSHIFLTLDGGLWANDTKVTWRVAETGQIGNGGHISTTSAEFKDGKWNVGKRWMLGFLDISKISFGYQPDSVDYLSRYAKETTPGAAADLVGIWRVEGSGQSFNYFFYKGFRVFFSDMTNPTRLQGGGYWFPQGGSFGIRWDWGNDERLTLTSKTTATGSDGNGPMQAKKVPGWGYTIATKMAKFTSNQGVTF